MNKINEKRTMGPTGIFGLPFLLGGCIFLYAMIDPSVQWSGGRPPLYFGVPFCLVFITLGGAIMFSQWGYMFDPLRRIGHTYWGVFTPLVYKKFRFDEVDHVLVKSETRRNKNNSYTVYPVRLILKGNRVLNIENSERNYLVSRERAEKISRSCQFKLLNMKEGKEVLEAKDVDKSFKEKMTSEIQLPKQPKNSHISFEQGSGETKISSSYKSSWIGHMVPFFLVVSIYIPGIFILIYMLRDVDDLMFRYLFFGISSFPAFLIMISRFLSKSSGFDISINRERFDVVYRNFLNKKKSINLKDIDDITIVNDKDLKPKLYIGNRITSTPRFGVYIISGNEIIRLNEVMTKEDESYLLELISYSISRF